MVVDLQRPCGDQEGICLPRRTLRTRSTNSSLFSSRSFATFAVALQRPCGDLEGICLPRRTRRTRITSPLLFSSRPFATFAVNHGSGKNFYREGRGEREGRFF